MQQPVKITRALISVTDKKALAPFAKGLIDLDCQIVASGGTADFLRDNGLTIRTIEEFSGQPALFSGRIKTLNFKVQSAILYDRQSAKHKEEALTHQIEAIDCVVCNFYDFQKAAASRLKADMDDDDLAYLIEQIDIGGPSMVRAAAKNFNCVLVVTDPADYNLLLTELTQNKGYVSYQTRKLMMKKAFWAVQQYDRLIAEKLGATAIKYGENPHQRAYFLADHHHNRWQNLTTNPLSYNNYLDINSALDVLADKNTEFPEKAGAVVIKHNNPCGFAVSDNLLKCLELALAGDMLSAFGSVIGFSHLVDLQTAEKLKSLFIEAVVAPAYDSKALALLSETKKKLKIIKINGFQAAPLWQRTEINSGVLTQEKDSAIFGQSVLVTKKEFDPELLPLAKFAMIAAKALKSNAVSLARKHQGAYQLLATGGGQPNRIDALDLLAFPRAERNFPKQDRSNWVLASDAFFPFSDSIASIASQNIKYIVQPGGSIKDPEVIAACDKMGIAMLLTKLRHFKH